MPEVERPPRGARLDSVVVTSSCRHDRAVGVIRTVARHFSAHRGLSPRAFAASVEKDELHRPRGGFDDIARFDRIDRFDNFDYFGTFDDRHESDEFDGFHDFDDSDDGTHAAPRPGGAAALAGLRDLPAPL
ncbi:hypothetical protein LO772_15665 [Yinghuangia sp. ASG 101]|uniref:hypothetical protein n=1 Tax=Yinghuangia sp. ASG 101 TaxID=2896848 RepID=UPI001E567A5B|nr:hypothetical protein [Yinghuangia sp. ASG 101]UGQ14880.1 hypothetical protein LO772_15665 [Yinghuangia sp. ASG 101]